MSLFSSERVLVPIDFSEASFKALDETLKFVQGPSHVYALHVLPHLSPTEPGTIWGTITDETRQQNVERAFHQRCQGTNYEGAHFQVLLGDPSSVIIDYAKKADIELIVIPSHGRQGLNRFLMGSVAERVVRFAHCPVLVLRRN